MTEISVLRQPSRMLTTIAQAATTNAKLQAVIDYAKRAENLELLDAAVDEMIDFQQEVVDWWREHVSVRHGLNRHSIENADRGSLPRQDAETKTGLTQQQISRWKKDLQNPQKYKEKITKAARRKANLEIAANHRAQGTGENEWYTPAEYIEMAREVLGIINLDPATSALANETVRAEQIFTIHDNALIEEWHGHVWMNPPYAQPLIQQFIEKLTHEFAEGHIIQAIALTHNYTDTAWFHCAAAYCNAICFTRGRIAFINPDGEKAAPTQGQAFFYFGGHPEIFCRIFKIIGFVVMNYREIAS